MANNYEVSYEELLDLNNKISPYQQCLNSPTAEVYKWLNGICPSSMDNALAV